MKHDEHRSEETINLYLDGELGDGECASVEAHLAECSICRAEVESLLGLFVALGELADAPTPDMAAGVVARIRPRTRLAVLRWLIPALQGAAAVGLLAWGWVRLAGYLTAAVQSLPLKVIEETEAWAFEWIAVQWSALDGWVSATWAQARDQLTLGLPLAGLDLPAAGLVTVAVLLAALWVMGNTILLRRILGGRHTAQPA
jgi:anti-sigma factor RsiW